MRDSQHNRNAYQGKHARVASSGACNEHAAGAAGAECIGAAGSARTGVADAPRTGTSGAECAGASDAACAGSAEPEHVGDVDAARAPRHANIPPSGGQRQLQGANPKRKRRKAPFVILGVLLAIILAFGGAVALYAGSLSGILSYKGDSEQLNGVLTKAKAGEPFYILVIGSDEWEDNGARSDAMVLVRVDVKTPTITMVSVPRDTPYQIDDRTVKLNQVFSEQGEAACIQAVSQLTGVGISHFVKVGFDQLEEVVDTLGGVEVDVPYSFDYQVYTHDRPTVHVDAGKNVLTGEQAVALARMRTAYSYQGITQDAIRQANVRALMVGIIKQVLTKPSLEMLGQIRVLASMVETDISLVDLASWALKIAGSGSVTVYSCTGPTEGNLDASTGLWLTEEAPEQWEKIMTEVDAGRDPSLVMERTETTDGAAQVGSSEVIEFGK